MNPNTDGLVKTAFNVIKSCKLCKCVAEMIWFDEQLNDMVCNECADHLRKAAQEMQASITNKFYGTQPNPPFRK